MTAGRMSVDDAAPDLEKLFHAQYQRIARVIAGVIKDPARAEELAVEVFLKWERTPNAQGESAEGWLHRAAVRMALNELRRRALHNRFERALAFVTHRGPGKTEAPDAVFAAREDERRVRLVLGVIEPRQAELLLLRSNDFSYQELASMLKLNPASVGTLLSRALRAFRKEFVGRYGAEYGGKERYGDK